MNRIFVPATSVEDWKPLLAQPDLHWKEGHSAMLMAKSWQSVNGFPPSLKDVFNHAGEPFSSLTPLIILPEHQVPLDTGKAPSQSDVWVLAHHRLGLASITVEGKASESFDDPLDTWLNNASQGRKDRLQLLTAMLGLPASLPGAIRYQFLHRVASSLIEAKQFHANLAICIIQSFNPNDKGFTDFQSFVQLFRADAQPDKIVRLGEHEGIPFYAAWVRDS